MTKAVRAILQALSYGNIEVESARRLADLKKLDPMRIFLKNWIRKSAMEIIKFRCACISQMRIRLNQERYHRIRE